MAAKNSKWPKKYKILRKMDVTQKTVKQNVICNKLCGKYFDRAKI